MKESKPTIGKVYKHLLEMNRNREEANRELRDQMRELVEINRSQQEGNRQFQDQIRELVDINRSQQEGFQQFFQMLANQTMMFPQQRERHQVTAAEVPRLSIGPLEDSDTSGNYRKCKEGSSSAVIKKLLRKQTIPVICNNTKGVFYRNEIVKKGFPSIWSKSVWLFPGEFELLSGNEKSKNWKKSIYIDMKRLKKHSDVSGYDLTKLGRITLYDLFMQTEQKLPNQKVRQPVIMEYRHLF